MALRIGPSHLMISWSLVPFLRLTPALLLGIVAYLYFGENAPDLLLLLLGAIGMYVAAALYTARRSKAASTDQVGLLGLLVVSMAGFVLTQQRTESHRADHIGRFLPRIEAYEATVDDYPTVRPRTFAATLRVSRIRVAGRWQTATGSVRVSLLRAADVPAPQYGQVWLVRGHPEPGRPPLNPGEFDYRRYLEYRQVYQQQFVQPAQYRVLGIAPGSVLRAISYRAARVLDSVFRTYIKSPREYALASALVLGLKDDIDDETKQAYASTGTTHIMAVSGLQVGLLFGVLGWLLKRLFGAVRGFRWGSAGLELAVIWSYAFVTGLSASVLRATVMFTLIIVARAAGRQSTIFNTLAAAAFGLLLYDPYLVADVGFQLSFLAVLSIVYLQPIMAKWVDARAWFDNRRRSWQPPAVQKMWQAGAWLAEAIWQATALSLAAQVATFPLGLYYFHQFPLSFLVSNLVAVPLSSLAVIVGLGLLLVKGAVALVGLAHPGEALHHRKALAFAFANAGIIAMYTLVDGRGVRESGEALRYVMLLFVLDGIAYPLLVWLRRDAQGRRDIVAYARQRWPVATLGGSASIGSYAIALWAMTRAPVASVAALRETSVLFAAVLGTVLLKERFGLQRAIGTGVIAAGVMALRFG